MADKNDLEKQRAIFAFEVVKKYINDNNDEKQKKLKGYIRNTPTKILTNGLASTLAFMFSKQNKNDGDVYLYIAENIIFDWLIKEQNQHLINLEKNPDSKIEELIKEVINQSSQEYRAVTNEVLALFNWLKRFADGMIEGDDNGN